MTETGKKWQLRDWLGLCVIPLELFVGNFLIGQAAWSKQHKDLSTTLTVLVFVLGFLAMIYLFRDFLKSQWQLYRQKLWRHLGITVLLVLGIYAILTVARMLLPTSSSAALSAESGSQASESLWIMFISVIPPVLAPFSEELTFRYLLFGKIRPKVFQILMFFISSILFGLIHLENFGGNWIQTIPYMCVGAYFALIYYFFDNIWGSIMTHLLFNLVNSVFSLILLLILQLLGVGG